MDIESKIKITLELTLTEASNLLHALNYLKGSYPHGSEEVDRFISELERYEGE